MYHSGAPPSTPMGLKGQRGRRGDETVTPLPEIKFVPWKFLSTLEVKLIIVSSMEVFAGFLWYFF